MGHRLSFFDLWRAVDRVADCLYHDIGVKKGDVVLILSPNSIFVPVVSLAVMCLGAVVTTANILNTSGYFRNEEATNDYINVEGWLKTGDLCYINEDGLLFVVDRLKELIKYKGYQVPPTELEALLTTHPDILDAAVIPFSDKEIGEYPMAYVARKPESNLSEMQVIDFISKQVAPYKKIRKVAFINSIPKTASGKTLRKDLIKLATSKL